MNTDLGPEHLPALLDAFEASRWETMALRSERLTVNVSRQASGSVSVGPDPAPVTPASSSAPDATPAPPLDAASAARSPEPAVAAPPEPTPVEAGLYEVRSPVLGTFYAAAKPGAPPFARVGQVVSADDTVAIVEVMKLMNDVRAGASGEIVEVCASNGQMVQYDEVLFRIRTRDA